MPRAALATIGYACSVKTAAHNVVTHTGQVLYAAAANEHNGVLLQVVALTADVARHLIAVGQTHARHLAQGRVGLFGRGRVNTGAHPPLLGRPLKRGHIGFEFTRAPWFAHQLINCRHDFSLPQENKRQATLACRSSAILRSCPARVKRDWKLIAESRCGLATPAAKKTCLAAVWAARHDQYSPLSAFAVG